MWCNSKLISRILVLLSCSISVVYSAHAVTQIDFTTIGSKPIAGFIFNKVIKDANDVYDTATCIPKTPGMPMGTAVFSLWYSEGGEVNTAYRKPINCVIGTGIYDGIMSYINLLGGFNKFIPANGSYNSSSHSKTVCININGDAIGQCSSWTPTLTECSLKSGSDLDFSYGTLTLQNKSLGNSTLSKDITMSCNGKTNALIYAGVSKSSLNGKIPLSSGNSLVANIEVNGTQTTSKGVSVSMQNGTNTLHITSNLTTDGSIKGGSYSGSGVLIISPQ